MDHHIYDDFLFIKDVMQLIRASDPQTPSLILSCANLDPAHLLWTLKKEVQGDITMFYQGSIPPDDSIQMFIESLDDESLIFLV